VPTSRLSTKGQLVIPTRLRKLLKTRQRAQLVRGKFGRPVLVAPRSTPWMTTGVVNAILGQIS
jgi:bifunctional DNA-binding transcriptional regulator/antitoxin component of YhaV-PrlF toxin-antitoxin module